MVDYEERYHQTIPQATVQINGKAAAAVLKDIIGSSRYAPDVSIPTELLPTYLHFKLLSLIFHLADVIGIFEYISPPKQVAATKTIRDVHIRNERDEALKDTFWNGDMNLIPPALNNNGPTPNIAATSTAYSNIPKAVELRKNITTPSK